MGKRARFTVGVAALAIAVPLALAACSAARPPAATGLTPTAEHAVTTVVDAPDLTIVPTIRTTHVPVTAEIGAKIAGGILTDVNLVDAHGHQVTGALRPDGSTWVPSANLRYAERYTATIVATSATGASKTITTSFTTASKPSGAPISISTNVSNQARYGVAMPIIVTFGTAIPAADRAAIESRLFVQSSPAQMGIWSWQSSTQVAYRPQTYWQPGTMVSLNTEIAGMTIGNRPIRADRAATFTIGKDLEYTANTKTHMLTITSDGTVIHTYPISAGKPSTPSWTGKFVIMEKAYTTVFNTMGIPGENYIVTVHDTERLTSSGTFFHSAPWSVYAQGHSNVSHGCINLSPSRAAWIYRNSQVGDPVAITGTPIHAAQGNGWTMWDVSWATFVKGSAVGFAQDTAVPGATPAI